MERHRDGGGGPPAANPLQESTTGYGYGYGYAVRGRSLPPPPPHTGPRARSCAAFALPPSPQLFATSPSLAPSGGNASAGSLCKTLSDRSSRCHRYGDGGSGGGGGGGGGGRSLAVYEPPPSRFPPLDATSSSSHSNHNGRWSGNLANIHLYGNAPTVSNSRDGRGGGGGVLSNPAAATTSPSSCLSFSGTPLIGHRSHDNSFGSQTLANIGSYGRSLPLDMDDASSRLSVSGIPSVGGRSYGNGFLSGPNIHPNGRSLAAAVPNPLQMPFSGIPSIGGGRSHENGFSNETLANSNYNRRNPAAAVANPSFHMPISGILSIGGGRSHENGFSNETLANINYNGRNPVAAVANPSFHTPFSGIPSIGGGRSHENSFSNETLGNINLNGRNLAAIANPSSSLSFPGIPSIGGRRSHESSFHSGTVTEIDSQRSNHSHSQKASFISNGDSVSRFSSPCIGSHSPLSQLSNSFQPNSLPRRASLDSNSLGSPSLPAFFGVRNGSVESFRNSLTNSSEYTNGSAVSLPYQASPLSTLGFRNRARYLHSNLGIDATYQKDILPGVLASREGIFWRGKRVASSSAIGEVQLRKHPRQSLQIGVVGRGRGRRGVRRSDVQLRREMRMLKALYNGKKAEKPHESGWEKPEDCEGEERQKQEAIPFYKEECLFDDSDDDYLLVEKNRVVDSNNNNNEGVKSEEEESNGWDVEEEEQPSKSDDGSWGFLQGENNYEIAQSAEIVEVQSNPIQETKKAAPKPPDTQREVARLFKRRLLFSQADKDEEDEDVDSVDENEQDCDVDEACFKSREELSFDIFCNMFKEQCELRKLYEDSCNCGVFYCLVCMSFGEKVAKRYPDLVSLVQHSRNILKTKKKAEHRGYSRAICHMMGWDPSRNPLSLKDSTIKPRGCIPPLDDNLTAVKEEHFQGSNDPIEAQSDDVTTQGSNDPIKAQPVDVATQGTNDPIEVQSVDVTEQGSKDPIKAQSVVVTTTQVNEMLDGIIKAVMALKEFLFCGDDHIEDDSCADDQQDPSTSHYNEGREDLTFDMFLNFLSEHQDLRELYVDHQKNSEGFDCLVCVSSGQKVQERYLNIANLIRHAKTTSKKRTRSEHMGYARALCNLLDIDPNKSSFSLGEEGALPPLQGSTSLHDDHATSEAPTSQDGSFAANSAAVDQHECK